MVDKEEPAAVPRTIAIAEVKPIAPTLTKPTIIELVKTEVCNKPVTPAPKPQLCIRRLDECVIARLKPSPRHPSSPRFITLIP